MENSDTHGDGLEAAERQALMTFGQGLAGIVVILEKLERSTGGEVRQIWDELGELRDGLVGLSARVESLTRRQSALEERIGGGEAA